MRFNLTMRIRARRWLAAGAVACAALVGGCGGGSSAVDEFRPQRMLSFGDEYSTFENDGRKYTINALDDDGNLDCASSPLWMQALAEHYDIVYPQCNPDGLTEALATTYAEVGAKADDVGNQVESYISAGGTFTGALVTVLVGTHDVLEQYVLYETQGEAALISELRARGVRLARTINRIIDLGGKVIVATTPDVGLTPYAINERITHTDTDRAALMTRMVNAMNFAMNTTIVNDGRVIGLVLADDFIRGASRFPSTYGLTDVSTAACAVELPDCTDDTLVVDASPTSHLWADAIHPGPVAHTRIGTLAINRATNNPF